MTRRLKPWTYAPFEVLLHAEMHYRIGEDFDRRIAMIGFDNAIEFNVAYYLNLKPIHRGGRSYDGARVANWLATYQSRVEFFYAECQTRGVVVEEEIDEVIWVHNIRNEQYHGGGPTVPQLRDLNAARALAMKVFSVLFDEPDVSGLLEAYINRDVPQPRTTEEDRLIDEEHGLIEVCGQMETASEVLFAIDPIRYHQVASALRDRRPSPRGLP